MILKNNSDGSKNGSLLQIMNRTLTIFGSRLLRHWVSHPLWDQTMISACLHAVSEIAESMKSCSKYWSFICFVELNHFKNVPDLEFSFQQDSESKLIKRL
ncbi:hypothetical protein S83_051402 [Arachis hypogaea]|nr:DNA mismatch repair protein [Arachis hypogaea]